MPSYDFLNLSPFDFELVTRDLLQEKLGKYIETFTTGPDGGIDLRCSRNGNIVIQCKRYSKYSNLKSKLKKELTQIKKLNPERYILSTSVGLTPMNKDEIIKLLSPYIKSTEDVIGKDDLNNLLGLYPSVEKNHFKLWLSSVNVLSTIINQDVNNQSYFALSDIKEKVKLYVQNKSFSEAFELLRNEHYVIISGIPGIGKTTLAEMLVLRILAKRDSKFEFIFLGESIDQGYKLYNKEVNQIFFFDDFLGSNFLESTIKTNEEKRILQFIKEIKRSTNKFLIFTTREYILQQAKQRFEDLDREDLVKCTIDLGRYTKLIKAKILYNHFYYNGIPYDYILELKKQRQLIPLVEHANYSPRIIETITKTKLWEKVSKEKFPRTCLEYFNNPFAVWKHVFENSISDLSRTVLLNLLMINVNTCNELFNSVKYYQETNQLIPIVTDWDFRKALRELEGTFTRTSKKLNQDYVNYHNPSIQDFLVSYLSENSSSKQLLIKGTKYLTPLVRIFTNYEKKNTPKIRLDIYENKILSDKLIVEFDSLDLALGYSLSQEALTIKKLNTILTYQKPCKRLKMFVNNEFETVIATREEDISIIDFVNVLNFYSRTNDYDIDCLFDKVELIKASDELIAFDDLFWRRNDIPDVKEKQYIERIGRKVDSIVDEILGRGDNPFQEIEEINAIESAFGIDLSEECGRLFEEMDELCNEADAAAALASDDNWNAYEGYLIDVEKQIEDLFSSF